MFNHIVRQCSRQFRARRGSALVLAAVLLSVVLMFTAFAVDLGLVIVRKTELQAAVDSAAMAGVMDLDNDQATVEATVDQYFLHNGIDVNDLSIARTIQYGTWNEAKSMFVVDTFENADALRVNITSSSIPSIFGVFMGHTSYSTSAESTVIMGKAAPRDIVLVLDCSGSMNASMANGLERIDNTVTAATTLINNLTDEDRVALAVYSWTDRVRDEYETTGRIETALNFDHQPTLNAVSPLASEYYTGGTNIGGGYRAALDAFLNDPSPRDASEPDLVEIVVMMTDGEVNLAEPYPSPNDGPTGTLPPGPYNDDDDYDEETAMQQWANTIKARGIRIYAIKLHGDADSDFSNTASLPDSFDDNYFFHIAAGSEDVSNLLEVYSEIGFGNRGPKIVH